MATKAAKLLILVSALGLFSVALLRANRSVAPAGYTGDFGERHCGFCHLGGPGFASVEILNVPAEYVPGKTYNLLVAAYDRGSWWWGFQLSARAESTGRQAGMLIPADLRTRVDVNEAGIQYISHSGLTTGLDQMSWGFWWVAPDPPVRNVRFSVATTSDVDISIWDGSSTVTNRATARLSSSLAVIRFPHVVVGGGYTSVFTLTNTGNDTLTGSLLLTASNALPLEASFDMNTRTSVTPGGAAPSSYARLELPSGGTAILSASRSDLVAPRQGWAEFVATTGHPSGLVRIELWESDRLKTLLGIHAFPPTDSATIPVNDDAALERFTGYAVANTGDEPIALTLHVVSASGAPVAVIRKPLLLGAGEQYARFLWQELGDPKVRFQGSLVVTSDGGKKFTVTGILQDRGKFAALPVIPGKAPGIVP